MDLPNSFGSWAFVFSVVVFVWVLDLQSPAKMNDSDSSGFVVVVVVVDFKDASLASGGGRGDGDPWLLFLDHTVHCGSSLVDLTNLVRFSGVVKNTLGGGGLSSINVGHDSECYGTRRNETSGQKGRVSRNKEKN
jgi:hypothetical protein